MQTGEKPHPLLIFHKHTFKHIGSLIMTKLTNTRTYFCIDPYGSVHRVTIKVSGDDTVKSRDAKLSKKLTKRVEVSA